MSHPTQHWDRSDLTDEVSGSGTVVNFFLLTEGQFVVIDIDHTAQGEFRWAETPRLVDEVGASFLLDCSGTNGTGFRLLIMRNADTPDPYGYEGNDLEYSYTRRGGLI